MSNLLSFEAATWVCVVIYALMLGFHMLVVVGAVFMAKIPIESVWGGRLKTRSQLLAFETVALVVTAAFMILTGIHAGLLEMPALKTFARYSMWALTAFFALNALGNLASPSRFEKSMAGVALLLSVASLRLAWQPAPAQEPEEPERRRVEYQSRTRV